MEISYRKLWKILIDKGLTKTQLRKMSGISTVSLAKLGKNMPVSLDVLFRICDVLKCDIGDVVEFVGE